MRNGIFALALWMAEYSPSALPGAAVSFVSLVLVTGEKERQFMSSKIKYTDEPMEARVIQDFFLRLKSLRSARKGSR